MIDDGNNEPQVGGRGRRGAEDGGGEGGGGALTGHRHHFIETPIRNSDSLGYALLRSSLNQAPTRVLTSI